MAGEQTNTNTTSTSEAATGAPDSTERDLARQTPFDDEQQVLHNAQAVDDDVSPVQTLAHATAHVTAEHVGNLIYDDSISHYTAPHYHEVPKRGDTLRP